MRFTKMHGCANDYVVVDADAERIADYSSASLAELVRAVCNRHRGVGADGFVLILPELQSDSPAQFEMRMYNPDGSYSAMCGNALRCVAKRLVDSGQHPDQAVIVRSGETLVPMRITARDSSGLVEQIEADLGPPIFTPSEVPCRLPANETGKILNAPLHVEDHAIEATVLSMGNPHCVIFVEEPADDTAVYRLGPKIEHHPAFAERTNVEFIYVESPERMQQRTWERGAGETLACGSGACAAAVAGAVTGRTSRQVRIELRGGPLDITWRESDDHVLMTGPATEVFQGDWPS